MGSGASANKAKEDEKSETENTIPHESGEDVSDNSKARETATRRKHQHNDRVPSSKHKSDSKIGEQVKDSSADMQHRTKRHEKKERSHRKRSKEKRKFILLVTIGSAERSTICEVEAATLRGLFSALRKHFKFDEDCNQISYYNSDFNEIVKLDKLDFLPNKAKIWVEKGGETNYNTAKNKEIAIQEFESQQLRIVNYQDELNNIIDELQIANRNLREHKVKIPDEFLDPITQEVMSDPVVTADGHTYEKKAIKLWLKKHDTSPLTNLTLKHKKLVPNLNLKKQIIDFRSKETKEEI